MPAFPPPEAYLRAAAALKSWLRACALCPRVCGVNRLAGEAGFCRAGLTAPVNLYKLHTDEEPPISGWQGSGTVFFAGCTLSCLFCQNHRISQGGTGEELGPEGLAGVFLELQAAGAHNLNLVTPTPHLVTILEALALARQQGLILPVVYNTSGYERAAVLRRLRGLVEVYLPDYKYADESVAERLSQARGYVRAARAAIAEMFAQVGPLKVNRRGLASRGVLVRHLVLPENLSGAPAVLKDLARISPEMWVSLMAQYTPLHLAFHHPPLDRRLRPEEYRAASRALAEAGLENGFVQELASASEVYVPEFR